MYDSRRNLNIERLRNKPDFTVFGRKVVDRKKKKNTAHHSRTQAKPICPLEAWNLKRTIIQQLIVDES